MMQETIEVGKGINTTLAEQEEQIQRINRGTMSVKDEIKKANETLTSIVRRIATDKFVLCFIFVLVTLVIAVIILAATGRIGSATVPPPQPGRRLLRAGK